MKPNEYITFFPGKGIYFLPSGYEIVSVYKAEEARAIFAACSYLLAYREWPEGISAEHKQKAENLANFYRDAGISFVKNIFMQRAEPHASTTNVSQFFPEVFFSEVTYSGTRNSTNAKEVDWNSIEESLKEKGYILKKRSFLNTAFEEICPVYYLEHSERGVIAEGKGVTDAQARKSALGEGIERVFAAKPTQTAQEQFRLATYSDLKKEVSQNSSQFDLGHIAGPRDMFSEDSCTAWLPAKNISTNTNSYLPVELAYYDYVPEDMRTRLFSLHHTMGLAAGSSLEDATLSGIFEILERDAYWITMRCHINCPDIDLSRVEGLDPKILNIIEILEKKGFNLSLKDMSLDWGISIAHAVITDTRGGMPAFSHGNGASFEWSVAIARAITEVLQVYSGMDSLINDYFAWEEVVSMDGVLGKPELAWSDPLFAPHIEHLTKPSIHMIGKKWSPETKIHSPQELLEHLKEKGHEVIVADLKTGLDIVVVRVFITNTTVPDARLESISPRLREWQKRLNLKKGLFCDPILT